MLVFAYFCGIICGTMNAKIEYWLELCDDDLLTAKALFQSKRYLHKRRSFYVG